MELAFGNFTLGTNSFSMPVFSDGIYMAKNNRMKVEAGSFCVPRMLVGEFER